MMSYNPVTTMWWSSQLPECYLDSNRWFVIVLSILFLVYSFEHWSAQIFIWNIILVLKVYCFSLHGRWLAAQSVFYHLYNQVSYMSLDEISPLTFSIGNTMKRISVIVSAIIIFRTPIQPVNTLGAAIAVLGTFLYSQVTDLIHHSVVCLP